MIHSLFPTTVYNIQIANTMRLELLDACNSVLTDVGEDHLLNIEGWNSTLHSAPDESNVINNIPIVIETFKLIKESIQDFLNQRNQPYFEEDMQHPFGFFSDMKKNGYLRRHAHLDCKFSGIIYLEVGDNVPPLVFHDPRPYTKFESSKYCTNPVITIPPQQGMMLIWDHWLEHEVYTKTNDNPRKSFTFNI